MSLQEEIECEVYGSCVIQANPVPLLGGFEKLVLLTSFFTFTSSKLTAFFLPASFLSVILYIVRICAICMLLVLDNWLQYPSIFVFLLLEHIQIVFHLFSFLFTVIISKFPVNLSQSTSSPPIDKPITLEEYHRQSVEYTKMQLADLRSYIKSNKCNILDTILRLKNPKQFARAIESNEMDGCYQFAVDSHSDSDVVDNDDDDNLMEVHDCQ